MARLMEGRTAFMIAHRLSTLDACNVRLDLDNGLATVMPASAPRDEDLLPA
jgi:ABC-type multidrug transport system fused ATPase/permease subunit